MKKNLTVLRKLLLAYAARILLLPLRLLPVKQNRVLFSSFLEKQYSCNPRYISEELSRLYGDRIEICWAFRNPEKFAFLKERGIKLLKTGTPEFLYYAMTARVVCTNTYYKPTLPRRKKQFFLFTWHGGGAYKAVGKYMYMPRLERLYTNMRAGGASLYLSSSKAFTDMTLRDAFGYKGEVSEYGMPRNDMLVNPPDEVKIRSIRARLGLKEGQRLCLYAPTYRADALIHRVNPDYIKTVSALNRRFGGDWVCGYRSHHVTMYLDSSAVDAGALNLTDYPDMQELLYVCDALITDYSSSIWDAALAGKRVFLYCPDLKEYSMERDFFTDIHTWPFPLSENMDGLTGNILSFDEEKYLSDIKNHLEALGSCETGRASREAAKRIAIETKVIREMNI